MTELILPSDIQSQLQANAQTFVEINTAYDVAQQMQATYEADRAASEAVTNDMRSQITRLVDEVAADNATIANLTNANTTISDRVDILTAEVGYLKEGRLNLLQQMAALQTQVASLSPDVTVTIGTDSVISRTVPAVSFVEQVPIWTTPAWPTMKANIATCVGAHKVHIFPFGALDPWGDPAKPIDLTTGNRLVPALAKLREVGNAPIILTLYGAPSWAKQTVYNGVIADMTASQAYSDSGRVKYSQLPKWLQLVDKAVEAAANAGCRDFEVWNELKGYYDVMPHVGQKWDAGMGTSPVMGFSYFAQATINQVTATMTRLGIVRTQYRISAPYMMLRSQGTKDANSVPSTHPLYQYGAQWGYANKAGVNALTDFLANAQANNISFDTLGIDVATGNSDGVYPTADPFDLTAKFGHYIAYVRSILPTYGYDADMPIDFNELYPFPQPQYRDANSEQLRAALWADCLRQCVLGRVRYPILWGPTALNQVSAAYPNGDFGNLGGLIAADGALQKVGQVFRAYRDNFGPGTKVYPLVATDKTVDGLASDRVAYIHNKTNGPRKVAFGDDMYTLNAYEVRMVTP